MNVSQHKNLITKNMIPKYHVVFCPVIAAIMIPRKGGAYMHVKLTKESKKKDKMISITIVKFLHLHWFFVQPHEL